jgi:hypothetical protein
MVTATSRRSVPPLTTAFPADAAPNGQITSKPAITVRGSLVLQLIPFLLKSAANIMNDTRETSPAALECRTNP